MQDGIIGFMFLACLLGMCPVSAQEEQPMMSVQDRGGVQYTRPDGTPIYVNPNAVAYVRDSLEGEPGNATIVFSNGAKQSVMETVAEVVAGIKIRQPGEELDGGP